MDFLCGHFRIFLANICWFVFSIGLNKLQQTVFQRKEILGTLQQEKQGYLTRTPVSRMTVWILTTILAMIHILNLKLPAETKLPISATTPRWRKFKPFL